MCIAAFAVLRFVQLCGFNGGTVALKWGRILIANVFHVQLLIEAS